MHKLSEELFQNAMNMSDTIVFQYDYANDSIHFSENVERYIPIALNVNQFTSDIEIRGKVCPKDAEKAISFFTIPPEQDKVKMEYLRFIDMSGEFYWYQLKGRIEASEDGSRIFYGTMTYVEDEDKKQIDAEGRKDLSALRAPGRQRAARKKSTLWERCFSCHAPPGGRIIHNGRVLIR